MYENGKLPPEALEEVEKGLFLERATAAAYRRMKADAARDGVTLAIPRPAGAYRSLTMQQDMHDRPWLYNLDPTSTIPIAPAGSSTHGLGTRVDIVRGAAGDWAIRHHAAYGFIREFGSSDPRHFKFTAPTWASGDVTPIEEDDMYTDADRQRDNNIYAAIFNGGPSMPDGGASLGSSIQQIRAAVATLQRYLFAGGPDVAAGIGRPESIFGLALKAAGRDVADVDEEALAAALAPILQQGDDQATLLAAIQDARADILAALALMPAETLAAFGLARITT